MATARCTANNVAQVLFTLDKAAKGKMTSVTIDNQSAVSITAILQDSFTPDITVGVPVPGPVLKVLKQVTVAPGLTGTLDDLELQDVDVLGILQCICNAVQALCVITVSYHEV